MVRVKPGTTELELKASMFVLGPLRRALGPKDSVEELLEKLTGRKL